MKRARGAALLAVALAGCAERGAPRAQLLVVLDTDLPVVDQLLTRPELSGDACMDSLRVDVLPGGDPPFFDLVVPDPLDWPVTFGVEADGARTTRLRVRLFRGQYAAVGELDGGQTLEPAEGLSVDRIVDLPLPSSGVTTVAILLSGDCLGQQAQFGGAGQGNCVDAAHLRAPFTEGIIPLPDGHIPGSRVGTWAPAVEVPCAQPGEGSRICIPGGFTLLGDAGLDGLNDGIALRVGAGPARPVRLSPFYLDRTELTVGELDQLLAEQPGVITGPLPVVRDPGADLTRYCTWLGGASGDEHLPLNCVTRATAAQICAARGGFLPSEAQWEHAARGRGEHRKYPWGDASPSCCLASLGRLADGCAKTGPEPVGSHPADPCAGPGDVSRDGVLDLGGSVHEHTRDALAGYADDCWQGPGLLHDPVCAPSGATTFISRGGAWSSPPWDALSALRTTDPGSGALDSTGLRCAYRDPRKP